MNAPRSPVPGNPVGKAGGGASLGFGKTLARRLKLRQLLFLLLLLSGIIPLLVSSFQLIRTNRDVLKTQEKVRLTNSARAFAHELSAGLAKRKQELRELGRGLLASPGYATLVERLREPWVQDYLRGYLENHSEIIVMRAFNQEGIGPSLGSQGRLTEPVALALTEAYEAARYGNSPVYRFLGLEHEPTIAIAVPLDTAAGERLVLQALVQISFASTAASASVSDLAVEEIFVVDRQGRLLWSGSGGGEIEESLMKSDLIRGFVDKPFSVASEYRIEAGGEVQPILARIVPVEETGWGVVAHKASAVAFQAVQKLVFNTLLISVLLVVLSAIFAALGARWLSRPIQRLTETSNEIVAGNLGRRMGTEWMGFEISKLAEDFNHMGDHLEEHVAKLKHAAEVNRELFINSIRAFAAAIDAKDPYTRGHSERVASYSRAIARHLGMSQEMRQRVWVSAVLHDVGKIGVDDGVLKKHGVLTDEEFDQMKLHPVIGADIVEPIPQLREMIPGIRWHHEAWNGSGYPDGLKGEQIPLIARIIGVADTFDAITTNRPYQKAGTAEFAIARIKQLTGTKFDSKIVTAFLLAWEAGLITLDPQVRETTTAFELKVGNRDSLPTA